VGSPISGREIIIGAVKGVAWGTPVLCGINHGLLVLTSGLGRGFEDLRDASLGSAWELDPQRGVITAGGDITGWLRYDNNEWLLLAILMGSAGVPVAQTGGGSALAYKHTLQLADGNQGQFVTIAQKMKSDEVWEFASVKITGFRITGGKRVPLQYTFNSAASHLVRNGATGTNNTTTLPTITVRETLRRIVPDETAYLRINDTTAAALGATDGHEVSNFELAFNRPQEGDNVLDGNFWTTEPVGTDHVETTLQVTFPTFVDKAAALLGKFETDIPQKMELQAQGGIIDGTERYRFLLQIPQAIMVGRPDITVSGPGKIAATLNFRLTRTTTAPLGMTTPAVVNPFAIHVVNKRATDILA
jgi:hypothetical protein